LAAYSCLDALLAHLFACRLPHPFIDPFRRQRLSMTLSGRIDWSAAARRDKLFVNPIARCPSAF
jgi:hypothetical protein